MAALSLRCFKEQCRKKPMYFCCSPEAPACMDCSEETCSRCNKTRTPLKSLTKKQGSTIITFCRGCNKNIQNNSTVFPCQHHLCHRCMAHRICQYLRFNKWNQMALESPRKSISCMCSTKQQAQINEFLQKCCFCCGQDMIGKLVKLKHGLLIRKTCKNRIRLDIAVQDSEKKCFLTKSQLQGLFLRCGQCMAVVEEKDNCKDCADRQIKRNQELSLIFIPDNVQVLQSKLIDMTDKKKTEWPLSKQGLGQSDQQLKVPLFVAQDKLHTQEESLPGSVQCTQCLKNELPKYLLRVNNKHLCWACYEASTPEKQPTIQTKPAKQSQCNVCSRPMTGLPDNYNDLVLCKKCLQVNNQLWKKHKIKEVYPATPLQKQKEKDALQNIISPVILQPFFAVQKDCKYNYLPRQNIKEGRQVYKCISCYRVSEFSITNTISSELGGYLCENCVFFSKQLDKQQKYAGLQMKRDNCANNAKKLNDKPRLLTRQFQSFDKALIIKQLSSGPRYSIATMLATIQQEIPDEFALCIESSRSVSCFRCGYFGKEEDWKQSQIGKLCISCFVQLNIPR